MEYKEVCLNDKSLFTIGIGKRITKKELHNKEKGLYPAYSANIFKPFGWVNKLLFQNFSNDYVLWGIDGNWSTRYLACNTPFVPTDHCGYLLCKNNNISLKYLSIILLESGLQQGFSRAYRASLYNIGNLVLNIPVDEKGNFDLQQQLQIAEKYNRVLEIQKQLSEYSISLNFQIKINDNNSDFQELYLSDIFDFPAINSGITEKFIREHNGNIPVYGGRKDESPVGYIADKLNGITYFENCLTWNRNGSVGYTFYRDHKFLTTDDCRPMIIKNKYKNCLEYSYLKNIVQDVIFANGFGWDNKAGKDKIKSLYVTIPIKTNGEFDLEKQIQIAEKYKDLECKRKQVIDLLKRIEETQVKLD